MNAGLPAVYTLNVEALAIDPVTPSTLYAGLWWRSAFGAVHTGLFKSTDGGGSWTETNWGLTSGSYNFIVALAIDPLTPSTLYAGTNEGVSKSTNGGASWTEVLTGTGRDVTCLAIDPLTPSTLYAGARNDGIVFKSTDGGASWRFRGLSGRTVGAVAIDPVTPSTVYAGTNFGVAKSTNGGGNWTTGDPSIAAGSLAIDPLTPSTLYAGTGRGVFRSTDGGGSWTEVNSGLSNTVVASLVIDPLTSSTLYAGTDGSGVFVRQQFNPILVAAVLPASRSVRVGTTATAFVTIINAGASMATSVGISPQPVTPVSFAYQTTNPLTNVVTGTPNTPADIPAGKFQTYVIALSPSAPFGPTDVAFAFAGSNTAPVATLVGINTLLLSGSTTPTPDIVALAATLNNDGIVNIPGPGGMGIFAVATVNVGASASITATTDTGAGSPPVTIALCQTSATGSCLQPPGPSVTTQIAAGQTPTFGIFVTGTGPVPFDPANNRVFVRFKDAGGVTRGSTSVALRTQ